MIAAIPRARLGDQGDQALLLILATAQRNLNEHVGRPRPTVHRAVSDVPGALPASVRPAVRPVLTRYGRAVERALRSAPDASPVELLRLVRHPA